MEKNKWFRSKDLMERWGINEITLASYIVNRKLRAEILPDGKPVPAAQVGPWTKSLTPIEDDPSLREYMISQAPYFMHYFIYSIKDVLEFEKEEKLLTKSKEENLKTKDESIEHSEDFRSIRKAGKDFSLTSKQAVVISILHDHWKNKIPDVSQEHLLERANSNGRRLRDLFKGPRYKEAWENLITEGKRKGLFRLKV